MALLNPNLFRAAEVVEREFEFPEGKVKLHLKTLSAMQYVALCNALALDGIGDKAEAYAWAIKHSLCDAAGNQVQDGQEMITLEQVKQLKAEPFGMLIRAVMEINGVQHTKP
ncbi:hypothetical protein EGK75_01105 [Neisseria weixii]|nr:hypothetical protein [Neisseria weixii]RPD90541.1 hypothetical protein EGK75_01105 [Neisseria weixii]